MKKKFLLLIITFIAKTFSAQLLESDFTWLDQNYTSIKEVKIFKDGKLGIIQQFDGKGNPIFIKNMEFNGDNIFAVWGYIYNDNNKLQKLVVGHSNVGFSTNEYVYKNGKNETYSYDQDEKNSEINSYPYSKEVKNISSLPDLLNSPTILKIQKNKKFLSEETEYNKAGEVLKTINKNQKGKIESELLYSYFENLKRIEFKTNDANFNSLTDITLDKKGRPIKKKYQKTEVLYNYENDVLKFKETFESGKPTLKEEYTYNKNGQITQIKTFVADYDKSFKDIFEYNDKGNIKKKKMESIEGISTYEYEYLYW